jgi:hypothetical protein
LVRALRVVSAWNRCAGWTLIRAKTPPNAQGTLGIDGTSFSGQVSGFAPGDRLDFADLAFGSKTTVEYDVTTHHLTVSDGVKVADVPSMVAPARAEITPIVLGSKWLAHLRAFAGRPILARELSTILRQW